MTNNRNGYGYTIESALAKSTGFIKSDGWHGFLPYSAANYLVSTGEYEFEHVSVWGYVIAEKKLTHV